MNQLNNNYDKQHMMHLFHVPLCMDNIYMEDKNKKPAVEAIMIFLYTSYILHLER